MEFRISLGEYSDDDEVLSFCDLVTEQGVQEAAIRDSNTGSRDEEGFVFDFGWCGSPTDHIFHADDLFRHGRLLPLALQRRRGESVQYSAFEKSKSENLLIWRNDSLGSESSLWSTSSSNSSTSQGKTHSGEKLRLGDTKSKGNPKPPASGGKMSAKWRVLRLGLMKPPSMNLEDMRLRQGRTKNNINGAKNLVHRRSVLRNYEKDPKHEEKEAKVVNFQEKRRSLKEVVVVKKMFWKTLAILPSFNGCKSSSTAVVENGRLPKGARLR